MYLKKILPALTPQSSGVVVTPWYLSGGVASANCIGVYVPKGAASLAASYVNLANPGTGDAIANSAPAWDTATGWLFDATTKYLTLPAVNCGAGTMIARTAKYANTTGMILGWTNSQTGFSGYDFFIRPDYQWNNCSFKIGSAAQVQYSSNNADVVHCISSAGAYINGTKTNYVPAGSYNFAVQVNCQSVPTTFYCYAVALYSAALTDPQVAAISTAMAAL